MMFALVKAHVLQVFSTKNFLENQRYILMSTSVISIKNILIEKSIPVKE